MLGKAQANDNNWYLCKYENSILYITKDKTIKPAQFQKEYKLFPNMMLVFFEDGSIYYFDKKSGLEDKSNNEYYFCIYRNFNFFKLHSIEDHSDYTFNNINKISFVGGIVSPMMVLNSPEEFNTNIDGVDLKISFNKQQKRQDKVINLSYGRLLLDAQDIVNTRSIDIEFNKLTSIDLINKIINKVYRFLQIFNLDIEPYVERVEIYSGDKILIYENELINNNSELVVRYNYLSNVNDKIKNIFEVVSKEKEYKKGKSNKYEKYDLTFLSLLDKEEFNIVDYYNLAKSVESIAPVYEKDTADEIANEIKKYEKLKNEIKKTINEFEKVNGEIDGGKKNFILSLIEISKFRQKVEFILKQYNDYVKAGNKYILLESKNIQSISKSVSYARNQIHGDLIPQAENKKLIYEIQYILMGLCIYIFDKCGLDSHEKFNMIDHVFSFRIQRK